MHSLFWPELLVEDWGLYRAWLLDLVDVVYDNTCVIACLSPEWGRASIDTIPYLWR